MRLRVIKGLMRKQTPRWLIDSLVSTVYAVGFLVLVLASLSFGIFLVSVSSAFAAPTPGVDALGAAKYCRVAQRNVPRGWAIGIFQKEFGDANGCIDSWAKSGKFSVIKVQSLWRASHNYGSKEDAEALKNYREFVRIARKYPNQKFKFSPFCEHNSSEKQMRELFARLRREATLPNVTLLNSPWRGATLRGEKNEVHNDKPRKPGLPYSISLDGTKASLIDMEGWKRNYSDAEEQYVWDERLNCRQAKMKKFIPPKQRTACADANYIKALVAKMEPRGNPPAFSYGVQALKKPNLWKTMSEDEDGNKDPRANKPVLLLEGDASSVSIKCATGREITKIPRVKPDYSRGVARYYTGAPGGRREWGFQIANRARKQCGSPFVSACAGRKCYGPFHPAFREGYYR